MHPARRPSSHDKWIFPGLECSVEKWRKQTLKSLCRHAYVCYVGYKDIAHVSDLNCLKSQAENPKHHLECFYL